MSFNIDKGLVLPFDDLPQPKPIPITASRPKIVSQIKHIIDGCNWDVYEANVLAAMQQAAEKYTQLYAHLPSEKVYQVSICTYPQVQKTDIDFETKAHAEAHIKNGPIYFVTSTMMRRRRLEWKKRAITAILPTLSIVSFSSGSILRLQD